MPEYRRKAVVLEARQLTRENERDLFAWIEAGKQYIGADGQPDGLTIFTLEGPMKADYGDWIVKGVKGEFWPVKPDVFAATYEPVPPLGCRCAEILAEGGDWVDCPVHAEADEAFVSVDHA